MAFSLLRKTAIKEQPIDGTPVYNALMEGLEEMRRQYVDRIVLTLYESKPSPNARGRWLTVGKDTAYYPFEMLDEEEQRMILGGKTYKALALVTDNVGEVVRYPADGVEFYHRTHVHPMLPDLKPESELNYVTEGGTHTGDNLRKFAKACEESGWTPEAIRQRVAEGVQEYRAKTRELMKKAGVHKALERMGQRKQTPLEQMLFG